MGRHFAHIEIEFEAPDHLTIPKYAGDAPIDFANRVLEVLRPELEKLLKGNVVQGYFVLQPRIKHGCSCNSFSERSPIHTSSAECREPVPESQSCPQGKLQVTRFPVLPEEDTDGDEDSPPADDGRT